MNRNIAWSVEGRIRNGERLDEVMQEMVSMTSQEPGALNYEWSIGEDGVTLHVYERYRDAEAALSHVNNTWQSNAERFMAVVEITKITTFSELTPQLKTAFAGAVVMTPIGGYSRP